MRLFLLLLETALCMQITQFIDLLNNPTELKEEHLAPLEKMLEHYPFFQSAHLLYAKALQNNKNINYHNALKKTAVIAGNRAVLYRLIQGANRGQTLIETLEPKQAPHLTIAEQKTPHTEPVSEPTPTEKKENPVSVTGASPLNISYTWVNAPSDEARKDFKKETNPEEINTEATAPQPSPEASLNEITITPVVEAYIETEILKITEKTPELSLDEPRPFSQWLNELNKKEQPILVNTLAAEAKCMPQETKKQENKLKKQAILEKVLNTELRRTKPAQADKNFFVAQQKTRSSVLEDENLVTETLAKIYAMQDNPQKAIRAYEILSLKFPEKSAKFAALINELKKNQK
ncbi:MAG: hypothetical protein JST67_05785 [Bacteroidetes bacterium]|nr:hypothetical protein [Bacteroidota bacterium]